MSRKQSIVSGSAVIGLIATVCLLIITGIILRREFFAGQGTLVRPPPASVEIVDNWEELSAVGHRIGPHDAPLTIVVFSDFQCPACGVFATELFPTLAEMHPAAVSLVFRHWPLTNHSFAYPAARAAECAAQQAPFEHFHDALFANQDSIGFKSFMDLASEVGLEDLEEFRACLETKDPVAAIERDVAAVRDIGGVGTPTVVVNGHLLRARLTLPFLDSISRALMPRF